MKLKIKKTTIIPLALALVGILLTTTRVTAAMLTGGLMVLGAVFAEAYLIRKEAKREGKEVFYGF